MLPSPATRDAHARLIAGLGGVVTAVPRRGPAALIEVGHLGPLPCWSMEAPPPAVVAQARTLARRGRVGLLIGDDPGGHRRTLATALLPVRPAVLDPRHEAALPLVRLRRLTPHATLLGTAIAVAAALDLDAAGRQAFRSLRRGIGTAVEALDDRIRLEQRQAWALLQVTRLLFLRFVESEGWLAGDRAFLARAIDRCLGDRRNPGPGLLAPLFFGTLNRRPAVRSSMARGFGQIPFLNGGLFEPHPVELGHRWHLASEHWQALFTLVVDGIEVTLDEGDVGDRVNPELLGRVFEGVMAPEERRASGTYFTPMALVPALVREAYACHLARVLARPEGSVHDALSDPDPELAAAMLRLTVLDPAVGSGAFLVGALQLARGPHGNLARRTRRLVARSLFGVDRDPAAVRLTELRLWLEVLRSMRGRPTSRVAPLPNLDTSIRAGDALLDPMAGLLVPPRMASRLQAQRRVVATAHGGERRRALGVLRGLERDAARTAMQRTERRLERAVRDLVDGGRAATLFEDRPPLPRGAARQLAALRRSLATVRRERRRLDTADAVPVFAIESAFAAELTAGGFDLVLGNPPWVRAERIPAPERIALAARYRWWRGSGGGWRHLPDLSVAFTERAVALLRQGGTMGLLLPAKLATARYAVACRAELGHRTTIHVAADLSTDPRAGFEATTYPMAIIASRAAPDIEHQVRTTLGPSAATVPQRLWRERGAWAAAPVESQAIAAALAARHPPLTRLWTPSLGVKTGANGVFLDPPASLRHHTRPVLRGRDLSAMPPRLVHRMLWPADARGEPWSMLPEDVASYLAPHRRRLEQRTDLHDGIWWRLFRTGPATAPWRVTWPDLASDLRPVALHDAAVVPLNSCYVIACRNRDEMLLLAAWLASTPIRTLARLDAEPAAGGYRRFGARVVGNVPCPTALLRDDELREIAAAPHHDRERLDACAARLLGLGTRAAGALDAIATPGR